MDPSQTFINQALLNAIIVFAIQHLKNSKWFPWLSAESSKLNKLVAVLASGAAAFGVHSTFDHTTGVLMVTGLTLSTIWSGVYNWALSYFTQQVIFKATTPQNVPMIAGTVGAPLKSEAEVAGKPGLVPTTKP